MAAFGSKLDARRRRLTMPRAEVAGHSSRLFPPLTEALELAGRGGRNLACKPGRLGVSLTSTAKSSRIATAGAKGVRYRAKSHGLGGAEGEVRQFNRR